MIPTTSTFWSSKNTSIVITLIVSVTDFHFLRNLEKLIQTLVETTKSQDSKTFAKRLIREKESYEMRVGVER